MPEPGRGDVAGDRARAAEVGRRIAPQLGHDALEALLGGGVVGRAHERDHLAVALLEQPRHDLHAEEAGGAGQEDRRLHASTSSRTGAICVPIAWKPPSTWMISAVIARAASDSRKLIVSATGAGSSTSQRQRRLLLPRVREVAEARDAARGERRQRARRRRGSRARGAGRGRAPGSARSPPARPWPRPSSRRPARRPARRSRARRSPRPPPGTGRRARRPAPSARTPTSGTR